MEVWKPVVNYDGFYSVSNTGKVRRDAKGKGTYVGRILRPALNNQGYWRVLLCVPGRKDARVFIHKLVAEAFLGPRPLKHEVNHKNAVRSDNRIENLEWMTRAQNSKHSFNFPRKKAVGEKVGTSKLTPEKVIEMRSLRKTGQSFSAIARLFGVSQPAAREAVTGYTWKHVAF